MLRQPINIENLEKKWLPEEARQIADATGYSATYVRKVIQGVRKNEIIEKERTRLQELRKELLKQYIDILMRLHNPLLQVEAQTEEFPSEVYATDTKD